MIASDYVTAWTTGQDLITSLGAAWELLLPYLIAAGGCRVMATLLTVRQKSL